MGDDRITQVNCSSWPQRVKCNFGVCLGNDGWLCQQNQALVPANKNTILIGQQWNQQCLTSWKWDIGSCCCGFLCVLMSHAEDAREWRESHGAAEARQLTRGAQAWASCVWPVLLQVTIWADWQPQVALMLHEFLFFILFDLWNKQDGWVRSNRCPATVPPDLNAVAAAKMPSWWSRVTLIFCTLDHV